MQEEAVGSQMLPESPDCDKLLDASLPNVHLTRIAFGSCHSRGAVNKRLSADPNSKSIWDVIAESVQPQTFLWTGDSVYPPLEVKGDTPLDILKNEFHQMKTNTTLGYANFIHNNMLVGGVHGTWDDHDYGGNDRGHELKGKDDRRDAFLDFLGVKRKNNNSRQGVYSSVEFGQQPRKVKVVLLDTRYNRSKHCIPSVGSHPYVPHGAIIACLTRWITSGLNLCTNNGEVLGEEQWAWLERELAESTASIHIIVSSIQVLTTNSVVESWGHFPKERERLLKLINHVSGLILLSGDVHHAEISTITKHDSMNSKTSSTAQRSIIEVTSSGLTHSCDGGWYGPFCQPISDYFPKHRFQGGNVASDTDPSYFTKKNFGSISIDWKTRKFDVKVHDESGRVVLNTGPIEIDAAANLSESDLDAVDEKSYLHFQNMAAVAGLMVIGFLFHRFLIKRRMSPKHSKSE